MLRMSKATLARRRKLGLPPDFVRLGRKIYYRTEDLERFIRENVVKPNEEAA